METTVSWRAEAWPRLLLAPGHAPGHAPGQATPQAAPRCPSQATSNHGQPWLRLGYALATPWLLRCLCREQPPTGFGHFARLHAPPALGNAQGGLQSLGQPRSDPGG